MSDNIAIVHINLLHTCKFYCNIFLTQGYIFQNNSDPIEHATFVWDTVIKQCPAKHIAVVAHSFGGVVAANLVSRYVQLMNTKYKLIF